MGGGLRAVSDFNYNERNGPMLCELYLSHTRLGLRTHVMHGYLSLLVTPNFSFILNFKIKFELLVQFS